MLVDNERTAEGNHHQRTEDPTENRDHHDRPNFEIPLAYIPTQKNESWQCEDHPCSNAFASRTTGLNDVVLKDTGSQEPLADRDCQDRNRNRSGYRQSGLER